jgi:hypothetical protein
VAKRSEDSLAKLKHDDDLSLGGLVDLVKAYATQETIGPLKGAGQWLGYGIAGAVVLALGATFLLLGLLRLLQAEWTWSARGSFSWVSYLIVLVVCVAWILLAVQRIGRSGLNTTHQEDDR